MFKSTILLLLHCHLIGLSNATEFRIIGGKPVDVGEFPYQVSLRRISDKKHFCGGSIITPKHVLTAAHCMYRSWVGIYPPSYISVVAGQVNLELKSTSVYRMVVKITVHEEYDKDTLENDIAMIETSIPFPLTSHPNIRTILLRNETVTSGNCTVSGWGVEEFGSETISDVLLSATVSIVDLATCRNAYGVEIITERMLCAGHEEGQTDACQGDSGGPLVCEGLLTGIVSTGNGCGNAEFPGIYTDVAKYRFWITSVLNGDVALPTRDEGQVTLGTHLFTNLFHSSVSNAGTTVAWFFIIICYVVVFVVHVFTLSYVT